MTIIDILEANAKKFPNKIAIAEVKEKEVLEMTWSEVSINSNKFAIQLINDGFKENDKICILLDNCLQWIPIFFSIIKIGAIVVPINHYLTIEDIEICLDKSKCTALITTEKNKTKIKNHIKNKLLFYTLEDYENVTNCNFELEHFINKKFPTIDSTKNISIHFSSGTTGTPKAILHKHSSFVSSGVVELVHHNLSTSDSLLCVSPLFHMGIKMHWLGILMSGGKLVILNQKSPKQIISTIHNQKISVCWFPLPVGYSILEECISGEIQISNFNLSKWKLTHMGSQQIPSTFVKKWLSIFPKQHFDISYGLTEAAGPGCINLGWENISKENSIGKAGILWEAKIFDENHNELCYNETGELALKGPGIMVEYFNDKEATNNKFYKEWLLTGDLAYKDQDGFIYISGRKNDMINYGGINIYPTIVENRIRKHPCINDVAVIGIDNSIYGELVVAAIELKPNSVVTKNDIKKYCLNFPYYEIPRKILFMNLPRNSLGKVDKNVLKKIIKQEVNYDD